MPFEFDPKYDHLIIVDHFAHWRLYLHDNQCYPGRMYAAAYRDFVQKTDMVFEEREALAAIEQLAVDALSQIFRAEHFNFFWGANEWVHAHSHIIPRYPKPVTFMGHTFVDDKWGHNYAPYKPEYRLDHQIKMHILVRLRMLLPSPRDLRHIR